MAVNLLKRMLTSKPIRHIGYESNLYRMCTVSSSNGIQDPPGEDLTMDGSQEDSSSSDAKLQSDLQENRFEELFFRRDVQRLLGRITGFQPEKIFPPKIQQYVDPVYRFMTDAELEMAQQEAKVKGLKRLRMPPFLRRKPKEPEIISKDPELQGVLLSRLVCVDITQNVRPKDRVIVIREKNGILREANHNERYRANQMFFPTYGRELMMPSMFKEEHLLNLLDRGEYKFALDRACIQFEPDDPDYIRVTETIYKHVNKTNSFDILRSTRHFGPMAYFLAVEKCIEKLLIDMVQRTLVNDAVELVQLYYLMHKPSYMKKMDEMEDELQFLKSFAAEEYADGGTLNMVLQSLKESRERQSARN